MDRRKFIKLALAGTGSTLIVPGHVLADSASPMAGGLYHTVENPGRWSKKVASHSPNVEIGKKPEGTSIQVLTRHGMDDYEHYIIKHMLLDGNYRFIDERMFIPGKDKEPRSEFILEQYSGPLYVLSVCNKHDTWLTAVEV